MGAVAAEEIPPEPHVIPNIEAIAELIKIGGALDKLEKVQGEKLTEIGKKYQHIEKDLHGNRAAVSLARRLVRMSADKRNDYMRTLEPLLEHLGFFPSQAEPDLADRAEGKTSQAPADSQRVHNPEGDPDFDALAPENQAPADEAAAAPPKKGGGKGKPAKPDPKSGESALDTAAAHLESGTKPGEPQPEPEVAAAKKGRPNLRVVDGPDTKQ